MVTNIFPLYGNCCSISAGDITQAKMIEPGFFFFKLSLDFCVTYNKNKFRKDQTKTKCAAVLASFWYLVVVATKLIGLECMSSIPQHRSNMVAISLVYMFERYNWTKVLMDYSQGVNWDCQFSSPGAFSSGEIKKIVCDHRFTEKHKNIELHRITEKLLEITEKVMQHNNVEYCWMCCKT